MANTNENRKKLSDKSSKKDKKAKGIFTVPLVLFLLLASFLIIAYNVYRHTYFKVSQVYITGNVKKTDEEILTLIGNPVGESIFTYDTGKNEEILMGEKDIKNAQIEKEYPDDISINIEEIYPFMEVDYKGRTYAIANTGQVLSESYDDEKLAKLTAIKKEPEYGQNFTDDKDKLNFLQKLQRSSYARSIEELNLENEDDIGIIIKGIQVKFGKLDKLDYKIKLLDSVLKDIDQKDIKAKKIDLTKGQSPVVEVEDDSNIDESLTDEND